MVGGPSSKARTPVPKSRAPFFDDGQEFDEVDEDEQVAPQTPPDDDDGEEPVDEEQPVEPDEEGEFPEEWAGENGDADPEDEVFTPNGDEEMDNLEGENEGELEMEDELPLEEAADDGELEGDMEEELPEDLPEEPVEDPPEELPDEPEEEFQLAAHWGLLDAVDEEDNFYEEELPEEEMSEPEAEEEAGNNSLRAEDMRLDEVPEHLRDATETSERIKKMLEGTGVRH
jgi:hypothetical protein